MLKNAFRAIMSHTRDATVLHAIDNRIFITIPLYSEKSMIIQSTRIENGQLIILGKLPKSKSDVSEQVSHSSPS